MSGVDARVAEARAEEAAGRSLGAIRAWQRVLALAPDHEGALAALAELYEERGELERAAGCRRQLGREEGPPPPEEPAPAPPPGPDDADLVRFCHLFGGREDTHARMWRDGEEVGWSPVPQALTPELLRAHVAGSATLGVYALRLDGAVGWIALDLDATADALRRARGDAGATRALRDKLHRAGLALRERLRGLGIPTLLEDSGYKGRHLWVFLAAPGPGPRVHAVARALAALAPPDPDLRVEAFPKQGQVRPDGLGNLVKLPLGLHLRSGRRADLLGEDGERLADPWPVLRAVERVPLDALERRVPAPTDGPLLPEEDDPPAPPVAERPWNEGDFDASPTVGAVLRGCAVLREVVRETLAARSVRREAAMALNHSLGHLADGPRAVNYLYDRVPGAAPELRMGAPHRGSPVSCARIRQRLASVAERVGCDCGFDVRPGGYAHPLLHLESAPRAAPPRPGLDDLLDAYGRLVERRRVLDEEMAAARAEVAGALARVPDRRWRRPGGEWVLDQDAGLPVLRWEGDR